MGISQFDLVRIRRWCDARVPKHLWDQLKVDADVTERHITIVEVRPPWDGQGEHTRFPIARLRYTKSTKLWSLYWRNRNLKLHAYDIEPSPLVDDLLDYIENSATPSSSAKIPGHAVLHPPQT